MKKYLDESLTFEERAKDLVSHMSLEEKVAQTLHSAPAIERLGVPEYNWWSEGLHGVARAGTATVFPQAIGLAATFCEEVLHDVAKIIAHEGRAKYNTNALYGDRGIYKGLTFWSPNVNIFRDPRWGRGHETYGEDPYLTSRLGVSFIKGIQGDDPRYLKAAACAKHFAVHSGPEKLRHEFDAIVSEQELRRTYLPAFKACVLEADVEIVMGAYNRTNGEPCCGSKKLLVDILRDEWHFSGHVTSDCWAIKDFHLGHKVTQNPTQSVALAMNMGCDLNCGNLYLGLLTACLQGLVSEETITVAVERLMTTRMKLGLFDAKDKVPFNNISYLENDTPENRAFNIYVAQRTLVLLKNESDFLPLKAKDIKTVAVIGPNADSRAALEGNYFGTSSEYVTVLEGVRKNLPEARILFAEGCPISKEASSDLSALGDRMAEAIECAKLADVAIVVLGLDAMLEGEEGDVSNAFDSGDKKDLRFPGLQNELLENICKTNTPVIVVNMTGSAMDLRYADENAKAIIQAWYPGAQGGSAIASLIFGQCSPSAKLPLTFYKTSEELPDITDYSMTGRTYRFMDNEPLYPFGFGLSYTKFSYSDLTLERTSLGISAKVVVKNTGSIDGHEISQLYIKHTGNKLDVPNYSLKGIKSTFLKAGESANIEFMVSNAELTLFDESGTEIAGKGEVEVFVGGSQPDKRSEALTGVKTLKGTIAI